MWLSPEPHCPRSLIEFGERAPQSWVTSSSGFAVLIPDFFWETAGCHSSWEERQIRIKWWKDRCARVWWEWKDRRNTFSSQQFSLGWVQCEAKVWPTGSGLRKAGSAVGCTHPVSHLGPQCFKGNNSTLLLISFFVLCLLCVTHHLTPLLTWPILCTHRPLSFLMDRNPCKISSPNKSSQLLLPWNFRE